MPATGRFQAAIGVTLGHAFVACAAIAGLVCAFVASLVGLTMRPELTLGGSPASHRAKAPEVADAPRRLVSAEKRPEDETAVRPQLLADFAGQEAARKNLRRLSSNPPNRAARRSITCCSLGRLASARRRSRRSSRASLASISIRPPVRSSARRAISRDSSPISSRAMCCSLTRFTVSTQRSKRFSIRRWKTFQLDLIIGAGPAARSVKIDLARFTLIGATTRAGLLTTPLRDRFGIPIRLNFYTTEELQGIVARGARVIGLALAADGANEIARRSRGTPRIAGRLLRRVRDFAVVEGAKKCDARARRQRTQAPRRRRHRARRNGSPISRRTIAVKFGGGPVGVETIAAALSEPRDAIEDIIEPYLIQLGFVQRTPRGRLLTSHAFRHLGLAEPRREAPHPTLFEDEE